jgi:hypothetical protein
MKLNPATSVFPNELAEFGSIHLSFPKIRHRVIISLWMNLEAMKEITVFQPYHFSLIQELREVHHRTDGDT